MKQTPLLQGKALLIELPEGSKHKRIEVRHLGCFLVTTSTRGELMAKLPPGNWRIIGMLSEVSEGEAEQIVGFGDADPSGDRFVVGHRLFDKEQEEPFLFWRDVTALESLESAILAEGYYLNENPIDYPNQLDPKFYDEPYDGTGFYQEIYSSAIEDWQASQSRVLDRNRCLLLGRNN